MDYTRARQQQLTEQQQLKSVQKYSEAWFQMMVRIWRDRLDQLVPPDTGTLRRSIEAASFKVDGYSLEAAFRFVQYGIYVDAGVGHGFRHGNGGNLQILDKTYRRLRGMKHYRKPRPWFSTSWAISRKVIAEKYAKLAGEHFFGIFSNI